MVGHLLMFEAVPKIYVKRMNKLFFNFIWLGKREKVRRIDMFKNCKNGGVSMMDVETKIMSFRLRWLG